MVSSLKERAPSLGLISTQPQGIQQNASTGKIEHATTLTYCQVITYTMSSIVFQINTVLQLWCQSIQPIPTTGILYIRSPPNPTIQKVLKPPFVTKCTFKTIFIASCCQLAARAVHKQRNTVLKKSFFKTHFVSC